jgi:hypothetical protein
MLELINKEINKEMERTGKMGTESVTIKLTLTNEQMQEFDKLDLNEHYNFEKEGNTLYINYTEDL